MLVVVKGIGSFLSQVSGNTTNGQVHFCQFVSGIGVFLSVNGNFTFVSVMAFDKFDGLHEHTSRATCWVIDDALIGFNHFGNQVYNALGGVEFSFAFSFGQGKF
ncbi:hypothetical protein SDC9_74818 [bioreactor metagenome]|uniref:Uncharacterized protein n=1 Tax=bioreactor metagenome TaxID=1076179 RepID=A0A644YJ28_9ZZZZ